MLQQVRVDATNHALWEDELTKISDTYMNLSNAASRIDHIIRVLRLIYRDSTIMNMPSHRIDEFYRTHVQRSGKCTNFCTMSLNQS